MRILDYITETMSLDGNDEFMLDNILRELGISSEMTVEELTSILQFWQSLKEPDCPICGASKINENDGICPVGHWSYDMVLQTYGAFAATQSGDLA